jgi:rhodanese-related sulfurtransferase
MNTSPSLATPDRLASLLELDRHPVILDVSTPAEYRAGHIEGAALVPLDELDPRTLRARIGRPGAGRYEPLCLTCLDGARARQAADCLLRAGYHNLAVLDGGNQAWDEAGLPVVRSAPIPSFHRQLQIAVGTVLLIPVVLGLAIHELFFFAVPLIAAGLILAGATDWSGMTRLLALMPWNRSGRAFGRRAEHSPGQPRRWADADAFLPFRGP